MNILNENCLVYAFDNLDQYNLFLRSVKSVYKNENNHKYDLLILTTKEIYKENKSKFDHDLLFLSPKINYEIISIENKIDKVKPKGMFFWFFAPFYSEYKNYLIMDNDTIASGDLKKLFQTKNKPFSGVKTSFRWSEINNKTISYFLSNKEIRNRKYINTGIVLMQGDFIRNLSEENLIKLINDFYKETLDQNLKFADQEFLFINFGEFVSYIDFKWNIRIQDFVKTNKSLKNKNYIFHYNIFYSPKNKKYLKKIDFDIIFGNSSTEEKEKYFGEIYSLIKGSSLNLFRKNYIKKIIKIFEENK